MKNIREESMRMMEEQSRQRLTLSKGQPDQLMKSNYNGNNHNTESLVEGSN